MIFACYHENAVLGVLYIDCNNGGNTKLTSTEWPNSLVHWLTCLTDLTQGFVVQIYRRLELRPMIAFNRVFLLMKGGEGGCKAMTPCGAVCCLIRRLL